MSDLPSDSVMPDDVPLLTDVVDGERLDALPTLTEVVAEAEPAGVALPAQQPFPADGLPVLTETVSGPTDIETPRERCINEDALLAALQQKIETHLETVFAQKLAQLQQQAAEQTLVELKAALPELLRDALDTPKSSR